MDEPSVDAQLANLLEQATPVVQRYLTSEELDNDIATLGQVHKLSVGSFLQLKNIILLTLLGVIEPDAVVGQLEKSLTVDHTTAYAIAESAEKSIFQKVRRSIFGENVGEVRELRFEEGSSKDELRKEILDTTGRSSAITTAPITTPERPAFQAKVITPGSRLELLEQLHVLDNIPNTDEVEARLSEIRKQIDETKPEVTQEESPDATPYLLGKEGEETVVATPRVATYSKAPTAYNIDPYRELPQE